MFCSLAHGGQGWDLLYHNCFGGPLQSATVVSSRSGPGFRKKIQTEGLGSRFSVIHYKPSCHLPSKPIPCTAAVVTNIEAENFIPVPSGVGTSSTHRSTLRHSRCRDGWSLAGSISGLSLEQNRIRIMLQFCKHFTVGFFLHVFVLLLLL